MKNTNAIVQTLRTDPGANVSSMIEEDASSVTAKLVSTKHIPLIRAIVIDCVREVHAASAQVVRREHTARVTAGLDAADARARLNMANRRLGEAREIFALLCADVDVGGVLDPAARETLTNKLAALLHPVETPE